MHPEITALADRENKIIMDWSTKCGCTVLTKMFFRKMGLLDEALDYNPWIHEYRMHVFTPTHRTQLEEVTNPDFFKFKVTRNPFGRVVSSYVRIMLDEHIQEDIRRFSWRRTTNISFERFLDYLETLDLKNCDPHQAYQRKFFENEEGFKYDLIIKLEELEAGVKVLNDKTGLGYDLTGLTSHHHHDINKKQSENVAGKKWSTFKNNLPPYPNFYNEDSIRRVRQIYATDFEAYNYSWEEFVKEA